MVSFLAIAAALASIQYLAHAVLFLRAKPQHGKDEVDLLEQMKRKRWKFNGFERSYWDFYFGYGLLAILWGAVEIAILWVLVSTAGKGSVSIVPLVGILLVANVAHAALTLRYFFLTPVIFDVLIAILLAMALFKSA
jgi:hypothetical protein